MTLDKRSITLAGHRTSIALEAEFWTVLERMAAPGSLAALLQRIDADRPVTQKLASTLRIAALAYVQQPTAPD